MRSKDRMSCNNWNNCGCSNNNWNANCCTTNPCKTAVSDATTGNMNMCYRKGYADGFKEGYETGFRDGFWSATGCVKNTVMGDTDSNCCR